MTAWERGVKSHPLHHVSTFLVVDVADGVAGVGAHALAVEPGGVGASDGVLGQVPQRRHGQGGRGDARPVAEDAPAGRVGEHAVAEACDEEGLCGGFAEGGNHVGAVGVDEGRRGAAEGEGGAFDAGERDVAWVVWGRAGED